MAREAYSETRTTCPRDCYDSCGLTVLRNEDGSVFRVTGDRDHPVSRGRLCGKCALAYNGVWRDPAMRLGQPLKRTGMKGEGRFETVSWDAAISDIARRLREIADGDGADRIFNTHYTGTCAVLAGEYPQRFFNKLGATEVNPDTVCNNAGHVALGLTLGDSCSGFDPDTAEFAKCIVVWGANPSSTAPHFNKHWLPESGAKIIAIDPIAHKTAKAADLHLPLRPGSDAALAFGMVHVALRHGLVDQEFVRRHVVGWDEVAGDVEAMNPARTAELTGLDAALIEEAALAYAEGPSLMWLGQGMQRQKMGGNAFRACALLCAATANIAKPGAGIAYLNGPQTRGVDLDFVAAPHLADNAPQPISHMDLADTLMDRSRSAALICWNNNIVASNPEQSRLREALSRDDLFVVCAELFETDTTNYADYVLPAASFFEFDDLLFPYFSNTVSAVVKAMEPPGSARSNQDIFRALAKAMEFDDPEFSEPDREIIDRALAQLPNSVTYEHLKQVGTMRVFERPPVQFADLKFATPSGKIEIASNAAVEQGLALVPFPHADAPPPEGRYRVLSPASEWAMNSSYANDPRIQAKMQGTNVYLNPDDARAEGIGEGDPIELSNDQGSLRLTARLTTDVGEGVVLVYKGVWPMHDDASGANVNVLNPGDKTDMGESCCVHAVEASMRLVS